VRHHYLELLDEISAKSLPTHVSVKLTHLGLDLGREECLTRVRTLATRAEQTGTFLWIDIEESWYVDATLEVFRRARETHEKVGLCLQAYLYRTPDDLSRLMSLSPVIRLVKGAYDEPAKVAFEKKSDTDSAYYELASTMLGAARTGECTPIFGTHDLALIERIVDRAKATDVGKDNYQIHMLYGIRDSAQTRLVAEGHIVKTLVSYGAAWYRWYMRRLAERPANILFVAKSIFG